jgi:hypothetical protein
MGNFAFGKELRSRSVVTSAKAAHQSEDPILNQALTADAHRVLNMAGIKHL